MQAGLAGGEEGNESMLGEDGPPPGRGQHEDAQRDKRRVERAAPRPPAEQPKDRSQSRRLNGDFWMAEDGERAEEEG